MCKDIDCALRTNTSKLGPETNILAIGSKKDISTKAKKKYFNDRTKLFGTGEYELS